MINNIPSILQYFIPGYIFVLILRFFANIKLLEVPTIIISVVTSYVLAVSVAFINAFLPSAMTMNNTEMMVLQVVIAVCIGFAYAKISGSVWLRRFTKSFNNKTPHTSLWDDVVDYECGTVARVKLRNQDIGYSGYICDMEENGDNSWFALVEFVKYNPTTMKIISKYDEVDAPSRLMLRLTDVESMELYYDNETKTFK